MRNRPVVVIIGAINMDLVVRAAVFPAPGETVVGGELAQVPGGKGANQAVAATRLGASCHLVGRVGTDDFGSRLLSGLENHGVATTFVTVTEGVATGTAMTLVDASTGENAVVASPGANARLMPEDVDRAAALIRSAAIVLVSLDIPLATVAHTIKLCHKNRIPVLLDAAHVPSGDLPPEVFNVSILCPNQPGAMALLGLGDLRTSRREMPEAKQIAADLLAKGPAQVVLRLAAAGALYAVPDGTVLAVPAFKVKVKDATAAGDAFCAGLALARAEGLPPPEALRFANAAAALACTAAGAQPSLPKREDVDQMVLRWG